MVMLIFRSGGDACGLREPVVRGLNAVASIVWGAVERSGGSDFGRAGRTERCLGLACFSGCDPDSNPYVIEVPWRSGGYGPEWLACGVAWCLSACRHEGQIVFLIGAS